MGSAVVGVDILVIRWSEREVVVGTPFWSPILMYLVGVREGSRCNCYVWVARRLLVDEEPACIDVI